MIKVIENEGLRILLQQHELTDAQIKKSIDGLLTHIRDFSERIFHEILQESIPDIEVRLAQNSDEETCTLGRFESNSSPDHLIFSFYDPLFLEFIDPNHPEFILTIYHEMIHAMDCTELIRCRNENNNLSAIINEHYADSFSRTIKNKYEPILHTLTLLGHYRAEGIAIFCSRIITNTKLESSIEEYFMHLHFFKTFTFCIFKNFQLPWSEQTIFKAAYDASANVLFHIFEVCHKVPQSILDKIADNYQTGEYNLTDQELKILLDACRKLTLADYIQALISYNILGTNLIDLNALLEFCATIQQGSDCEDRDSFIQLLEKKSTLCVEVFQKTLQDISSYVNIPKVKIDELINNIDTIPLELRERVKRLYNIYKDENDTARKELCQWVFTYIIDKEDIIHDNLPVYGIVDDLEMLDIALDILNRN